MTPLALTLLLERNGTVRVPWPGAGTLRPVPREESVPEAAVVTSAPCAACHGTGRMSAEDGPVHVAEGGSGSCLPCGGCGVVPEELRAPDGTVISLAYGPNGEERAELALALVRLLPRLPVACYGEVEPLLLEEFDPTDPETVRRVVDVLRSDVAGEKIAALRDAVEVKTEPRWFRAAAYVRAARRLLDEAENNLRLGSHYHEADALARATSRLDAAHRTVRETGR